MSPCASYCSRRQEVRKSGVVYEQLFSQHSMAYGPRNSDRTLVVSCDESDNIFCFQLV